MDGLDKIYQMQKAAGKGAPIGEAAEEGVTLLLRLRNRWFNKGSKPLGVNSEDVNIKYTSSYGNPVEYSLMPGREVYVPSYNFRLGRAAADAGILGVSALGLKEGVDILTGSSDEDVTQPAADGGKQSTTTTDGGKQSTTTDGGKQSTTTDGGKKDDGGKTADAKESFWDSAVDWVEKNPWLAGAGAIGLGGLGYYAFSGDDEEEEEEEE